MLLLIPMGVSVMATSSYHASLVTHWDFEGDTPYADRVSGGKSSDTLTAHGNIVLDKGVAYIPNEIGAYFSASGGSSTDLYDFKNTTVVVKANMNNDSGGRTVLAALVSKNNSFTYGIQNESNNNASAMYVRINNANNLVNGASVALNEFRVYVMSFAYDETTKKVTCKYYMSTKEVPESASDFTLMVEQEITADGTNSVLTSTNDFILGRRYDQLDKLRDMHIWLDDAKVYSSVLTLDEVAADVPAATSYTVTTSATTAEVPNPDVHYSELNGLTMYAVGDSLFAGNGVGKAKTYVNLIGEKYGMTYINDGVGGSTIGVYDGYPAEKIPMVTRWKDNLPTENADDVDIILLEGGSNDWARGVKLSNKESTDTTTFQGAINTCITEMKQRYPNALIICITTWGYTEKDEVASMASWAGKTDYAKAMLEVCEYRGIPCVNNSDPELCGVNMNSLSFRQQYSISDTDRSHLNAEGMKLVLPYVEECIARAWCEYKNLTFADQTPDKYNPVKAASTTEATTTEVTTTEATTTAPEPEATTTAAETTAEEKKGCGSAIGTGAAALAASAALGIAAVKKKKKR